MLKLLSNAQVKMINPLLFYIIWRNKQEEEYYEDEHYEEEYYEEGNYSDDIDNPRRNPLWFLK